MTDVDNAPSPSNVLTLSDEAYYPEELKVLEDLQQRLGQQTIADVCRDHNIDQYDFKDRWGSLLRHNEPAEVLTKIRNVRDHMGGDVGYIAKKLGYTQSCVRTIIKKLQERPEDDHHRTKVNLAHRMMPLCGGSLKKAQAKLHCRRKNHRSTDESDSSSDDSDSDSDEDYGVRTKKAVVRVEKVSGAKVRSEASRSIISIHTNAKRELQMSLFDTVTALIDDPDLRCVEDASNYISPKVQAKLLAETEDYANDLQKNCQTRDVDYPAFYKLWRPLLDFFPRVQLEAFLYSLVVLYRLGYGYSVISDALNIPRSIVITAMRNFRLHQTGTHGRSFDVTVLLVRKEVMTSGRLADTCGIPKEVGRLIIKRCGQRDSILAALQRSLEEVSISNKILWLFERGLSVSAICTVLKVSDKEVQAVFTED